MEEKKLYVIGIGPGAREQMTVRADRILRESQVIIGYTVYVDLVKEFYPQAEFLTTPMRQEKERCEMALKAAQDGRKTAMICSGDSGVYGMAGLLYQIAQDYKDIEVEVVPGVTAACSGAAVLGAPLGHDFAIISLSDLLTPWPQIEKRLAAERFAAMFGGKTLIVAYNAQFDLCFLYYFLAQFGMADVLKGAQMLDALTVYKDRRPFPHKLCNAVDAYQLKTQNTHRAIDDARATLELLTAMEEEEQDLERYVNLFGYNPKFGAPRPAIHSVTYLPQGYNRTGKLYDEVPAFL